MLRYLAQSATIAAGRSIVRRSESIGVIAGRRGFAAAAAAADNSAASAQAAAAAASPVAPVSAADAASSVDSAAAAAAAAGAAAPARPKVRSAQLRAQRPRASAASKVAASANPDGALAADKCGPVVPGADEPQMVNVVNPATGERLGPRGLEPTRYGDWEAKGRCWDF